MNRRSVAPLAARAEPYRSGRLKWLGVDDFAERVGDGHERYANRFRDLLARHLTSDHVRAASEYDVVEQGIADAVIGELQHVGQRDVC